MTIYRLIAPKWLVKKGAKPVLEGQFEWDFIQTKNKEGYNVYAVPNHPSTYSIGTILSGGGIDAFNFVFVDMDLKDAVYGTKEAFIDVLYGIDCPPTKVIDSGNGVHAYWRVSDLEAKSYLRLSRRLMRLFNTDEAVGKIFQLMRLPGYMNTKDKNNLKICELLFEDLSFTYTCEELDKILPDITKQDETYCINHFEKTYNQKSFTDIDATMPEKFGALLRSSREVQEIFTGATEDRSKNDFRLGYLLKHNRFSKEEAIRVIQKGPSWIPAIQLNKPVSYRARQQITFVVANK